MRRTWAVGLAAGLLAAVLAGSLAAEEKKGDKPVSADTIAKVKAALPDKATAKPAKPHKIIIFTMTKGFRHGSIPLAAEAIKLMGEKTGAWEATSTDAVAMMAADKLAPFDAIIWDQCTGNITDDAALKQAVVDFVKNGKGLAGVHAATDVGGWKCPEFHDLIGGLFAGHPFRRISVKLDDPKHPLNAAFEGKGFEISDEIYTFKAPYSREKLRVLQSIDWEKFKVVLEEEQNKRKESLKKKLADPNLSAEDRQKAQKELDNAEKYFERLPRPQDNDYALSWIREYGKGRVFYCAFGHDDQIWWNPAILRHYLDGIQYALGDLKADATPSAQLKLEAAPGPDLQKKAAARPVELRLFAAPKADDGWITLFDGKDLGQWQNAGGDKPGAGWVIQDGAMVRQTNAGDIWTKQRFGDFVLDLEFKTEGNSGVFIRTDNPKDCVQTGIEMQVERGGGKEKLGRNDVGSVYDCLAPSKNPVKDGEWNRTVITAKDNKITIVINDVQVIDMDLNQWTEPNQNPDESKNKYKKALKDFKREGHIGFQDHGAKVSYRNVKVKPLKAEK